MFCGYTEVMAKGDTEPRLIFSFYLCLRLTSHEVPPWQYPKSHILPKCIKPILTDKRNATGV